MFDRQPTPRDLPSDSTVHTSELSTQPDTSPSRPVQPFLFDPVAKPGSFSSQDRYPQDIWQLNDPTPGAILFSTGPAMSKPVGGPPSESDTGPRSPVNGSLWGTPSGLASNVGLRPFMGHAFGHFHSDGCHGWAWIFLPRARRDTLHAASEICSPSSIFSTI